MAQSVSFFEDMSVGDQAPVLTHALTRTDLVRYAGASGDFNPMHHDEVTAVAAGQPSVFGHGMFSMGILVTAVTRFFGVGSVRRYRVRFSRQTWPGETLSTSVVVRALRAEEGRHLADLDVRLVNQDGQEKVVGEATVTLPSRG